MRVGGPTNKKLKFDGQEFSNHKSIWEQKFGVKFR